MTGADIGLLVVGITGPVVSVLLFVWSRIGRRLDTQDGAIGEIREDVAYIKGQQAAAGNGQLPIWRRAQY